jgi:hypothetical protein
MQITIEIKVWTEAPHSAIGNYRGLFHWRRAFEGQYETPDSPNSIDTATKKKPEKRYGTLQQLR